MKHLIAILISTLMVISLIACGAASNESEPNNDKASATMTKDLVLSGSIADDDQVDWFALDTQAGAKAKFTITHDEESDFDIDIFSGDEEVASAVGTETGDSTDAEITGKAFVKVYQASGSGSYQVTITPGQ